jgi:protein tyrosine phosphatase (PTP) superfamily phosphohydrolase (DUF442 family)
LEANIATKNKQPQITLPKSWGTHVNTAVLHVIALDLVTADTIRAWVRRIDEAGAKGIAICRSPLECAGRSLYRGKRKVNP